MRVHINHSTVHHRLFGQRLIQCLKWVVLKSVLSICHRSIVVFQASVGRWFPVWRLWIKLWRWWTTATVNVRTDPSLKYDPATFTPASTGKYHPTVHVWSAAPPPPLRLVLTLSSSFQLILFFGFSSEGCSAPRWNLVFISTCSDGYTFCLKMKSVGRPLLLQTCITSAILDDSSPMWLQRNKNHRLCFS